jgi:hypothetical protein
VPLPPHIATTFDAIRDAEAAGPFAQPTTLTNTLFASALAPDEEDPLNVIIHNTYHVANNTPVYRNRLREQQYADT